jgi:hypothetical protein
MLLELVLLLFEIVQNSFFLFVLLKKLFSLCLFLLEEFLVEGSGVLRGCLWRI